MRSAPSGTHGRLDRSIARQAPLLFRPLRRDERHGKTHETRRKARGMGTKNRLKQPLAFSAADGRVENAF